MGAFLERPIEGEWPYLWLDATHVEAIAKRSVPEGAKRRALLSQCPRRAFRGRDHRVVSVAVIVAVAVNTDGGREVLGMATGDSEAEHFWTEFLRSLARRGSRGVELVISDAPSGGSATGRFADGSQGR